MISPILPDSVPLAIWYSEGCRSRRVIPIRCCRRGVREPRNSSSVPVVRDRCLSSTQKTGRYSRFFVSEAYAKGIRRGMGLMTEYGNADWPVDRGIGQNGCRCCFWRKANKKSPETKRVSRPAGKVANCDRLVPGAGIEPARCFHRQILSLLRLPISPPRRRLCIIADLPPKGNKNAVFQAFFVAKIVKCSTMGGRAKNGPTTPRHWVKAGEPRKSTVWFSRVSQ